MKLKQLYKVLCLLPALAVQQAGAAALLNPAGANYSVVDFCASCPGLTQLEVSIYDNSAPIVLEFDPMGISAEDFSLYFINQTGADWVSFSIEYVIVDPIAHVDLRMNVIATGTSIPAITTVLTNPVTGDFSGFELSLTPPESSWILIGGQALRPPLTAYLHYAIVITPSAVPVPAAAWLFGTGLLGLIGVARRKVRT